MSIDETIVDSSTTNDETARTAVADSSSAPDAKVESSSTEVAKEPTSMFEAVHAAVEKEAAAAESSEGKPQSTEGDNVVESDEAKAEGEEPKPKPVSDDLKDYSNEPFNKHPRFRQVLKALREERAAHGEAREWRTANEKTVTDFEAFRGNVANAGLSAQDVAVAFTVASNMVNDPVTALTQLRSLMADLEARTGDRLPEDLQKKVDDGLIDEATALEVSRDRAASNWTKARAEASEKTSQLSQVETARLGRATKVSVWEDAWKKSDPDYNKKQPFVAEMIEAIVAREGEPQTEEASIALCNRAKKAVEVRLREMMPTRTSQRVVSGANTGASSTAQAVPKSMLDVVRQNRTG